MNGDGEREPAVQLLADRSTFAAGEQQPALRFGDLALTSTPATLLAFLVGRWSGCVLSCAPPGQPIGPMGRAPSKAWPGCGPGGRYPRPRGP
jgi:hypothetical protein